MLDLAKFPADKLKPKAHHGVKLVLSGSRGATAFSTAASYLLVAGENPNRFPFGNFQPRPLLQAGQPPTCGRSRLSKRQPYLLYAFVRSPSNCRIKATPSLEIFIHHLSGIGPQRGMESSRRSAHGHYRARIIALYFRRERPHAAADKSAKENQDARTALNCAMRILISARSRLSSAFSARRISICF